MWFLSGITPAPVDEWFFATQSIWSLLVIFLVLHIQASRLTLTLSAIEIGWIVLNLLACIGYLTSFEFFYSHYEGILDGMVATQAAVLFLGAPWDDIIRRLQELRSNPNHPYSGGYRLIQAEAIAYQERHRRDPRCR